MTAYVSFVIDERSNVLLVPNAALRFKPRGHRAGGRKPGALGKRERGARPAGPTVYMIRDNALVPVTRRRPASPTGSTPRCWAASSKAGDRVVVEDNQPDQKPGGAPSSFRMRAF